MKGFHNDTKEEKDLQPDELNWTERKERAAEHPPTGVPKQGSLLNALADEALSKGRPVLVIPLDAGDGEADVTAGEDDEPPHEMRLPKNTTVIFSAKGGFPAMPYTGQRVKVMETHGDLGAEVSRRISSSGIPDRVRGIRIVAPSVEGSHNNPFGARDSAGGDGAADDRSSS